CTANADENLARAIGKIREAAARGAQIISLHELFHGEYFCRKEDVELFNLSEPIPGPTTEKLAQIAKEKKVALVVSLFERRAPGVYHNSCAVLDADGSFLGKYRKMHIPDDPLYYEKFYFTPGDPGLEFWGNSFVADPFGQIVAEASNDKEEILVVECDPAKSEDTRRNWPFLRDRRIDAYQPILNRWLGEK